MKVIVATPKRPEASNSSGEQLLRKRENYRGRLRFAPQYILILGIAFAPAQPAHAATLNKAQLDALAAAQQAKPSPDFRTFLAEAVKAHPDLEASVSAYQKKAPLSGDDLVNIGRLLGLYTRLRDHDSVIATIAEMVAIPTVRAEEVPPHESKPILEIIAMIEGLAKDFGLQFRNVDNRVLEVRLPGTGTDEFGILTHADVVPVVAEEWILEDGTKLDPFKLTRVGDYLYGRGSIDDKGSIAAAMYAMRAVKQSGLAVQRTIRLMIDTTEETGGDAFKYYKEKTPLPEYNIVLDSKYPAVVAEKGSGTLKVFFPVEAVDPGKVAITAMAGAPAANTVPQTATATLKGGDLAKAAATLEAAKSAFIQKYKGQGGKFSIDVVKATDSVEVKVTGSSAHGSRPEEGVNPVPRLTLFLLESGVPVADNHFAKAARYVNDVFGTGYLGEKLGVGYADDFMGPLTMSPNLVRDTEGNVEVAANVRMPRGQTPEALVQTITGKVNAWATKNGAKVEIDYPQDNWMARDTKGAWLTTLLDIFGDVTGLDAKPVPTAGSTTAKLLPNAINFGPAMPGKKYTAHNANEFKEVADLDADIQMFTEMLVRIGNLQSMQ